MRVELIACNSGRGRLARDLVEGLGPGSEVVAPLGWVTVTRARGVPLVSAVEAAPGQWRYQNVGVGWVRYFHEPPGLWSLPR